MTRTTPVHAFVSNVIGGALLYQRAHARGIDTTELEDLENGVTFEIFSELTTELGLNFDHASHHVLASMAHLLCEESVLAANQKQLARMLWEVLGDPTNNGSEPPAVYTEAAKAVYAWMLVLIHPTFLNP
ncbi:MAG: hypothetical protein ACO22W_10670 [Steroidobacteraceae bacterium]